MPETIDATYKNGCFHPAQSLNLPDNESVRIIVVADEPDDQKDEMIRIMIDAGLIRSSRSERTKVPPNPVSEERRLEIAKKLGENQKQLLSETIISERER